ncbi:MAG TPA: type II toxin-antitoxin system VapC family toxin [Kiritimatiellia bacterium]|nr:type II toxin-antitoxin system VapC family toxin [Kiritimatiellia bacterium]
MVVYADTSFLFSLYAQDAHTGQAAELAGSFHGHLIVTPHQRFELRNAMRLSVFRGTITETECRRLLDLIEADIRSCSLVETPVSSSDVFEEAETLSSALTATLGIRASDVLHVAAARALGVRMFFTFDARQKILAAKAGLKTKP